jgi:hypothetical protein
MTSRRYQQTLNRHQEMLLPERVFAGYNAQIAVDSLHKLITKPDLDPNGKQQKNAKTDTRYQSKAADCRLCPVAKHCLIEKAQVKQLYRWKHQAVVEHPLRHTQAPCWNAPFPHARTGKMSR